MRTRCFSIATFTLLTTLYAPCAFAQAASTVSVASFNIKFLGNYPTRNTKILTKILAPYDLVFIQELVAPPYVGDFPDGTHFKPDQQSAEFFDDMQARGFKYVLSSEDTGKSKTNHTNATSTEWFVSFYKPGKIKPAEDLPGGFLAADRTAHPHYDRVPYAFPYRFNNKTDMVFISVHLRPSPGPANRARRIEELKTIRSWVTSHDDPEKDFVVLGDMNFENCAEIGSTIPSAFTSLNKDCKNTNAGGTKPYDNVLYSANDSGTEIDTGYGFNIIDLKSAAKKLWGKNKSFPTGNNFHYVFSDHNPVEFQLTVKSDDD